jgi:hypothetical protein
MSNQEVSNVFELTLDAIGAPLLDHESTVLIVTISAPRRRVTRLTDVGLPRGSDPVAIEPCGVMTQKGSG